MANSSTLLVRYAHYIRSLRSLYVFYFISVTGARVSRLAKIRSASLLLKKEVRLLTNLRFFAAPDLTNQEFPARYLCGSEALNSRADRFMTTGSFLQGASLLQLTEALVSKSDQVFVLLFLTTKSHLFITFFYFRIQVCLQLGQLPYHLRGSSYHNVGDVPLELQHIGQRVRRSYTTSYS